MVGSAMLDSTMKPSPEITLMKKHNAIPVTKMVAISNISKATLFMIFPKGVYFLDS